MKRMMKAWSIPDQEYKRFPSLITTKGVMYPVLLAEDNRSRSFGPAEKVVRGDIEEKLQDAGIETHTEPYVLETGVYPMKDISGGHLVFVNPDDYKKATEIISNAKEQIPSRLKEIRQSREGVQFVKNEDLER